MSKRINITTIKGNKKIKNNFSKGCKIVKLDKIIPRKEIEKILKQKECKKI